jgi:hypothetical protein
MLNQRNKKALEAVRERRRGTSGPSFSSHIPQRDKKKWAEVVYTPVLDELTPEELETMYEMELGESFEEMDVKIQSPKKRLKKMKVTRPPKKVKNNGLSSLAQKDLEHIQYLMNALVAEQDAMSEYYSTLSSQVKQEWDKEVRKAANVIRNEIRKSRLPESHKDSLLKNFKP